MSSAIPAKTRIETLGQKSTTSGDGPQTALQQVREQTFGPQSDSSRGHGAVGEQGSGSLVARAAAATAAGNAAIGGAGFESALQSHLPKLGFESKGTPIDMGKSLEDAWTNLKGGLSAVGKIAPQVASGAFSELEHNPLRVGENLAIGAVAGTALAFAGPEVAAAAGIVAVGYAGYELTKSMPGWLNDAKAVANPQQVSKADLAVADKHLQALGADVTDVTAGMIGGGIGLGVTDGVMSGMQSSESREVAAILSSQAMPVSLGEPMTMNMDVLGSVAGDALSRSNFTSIVAGVEAIKGDRSNSSAPKEAAATTAAIGERLGAIELGQPTRTVPKTRQGDYRRN